MNAEQQQMFQQALSAISPYMIIVGRERKAISSAADREQVEDGITLMLKAIDNSPQAWRGWWVIGKAFQALGDDERSYDAFQQSYDLNLTNPDVCREYMHSCLKLGRGTEAVEAASVAVSLNPNDAGLVANLALALLIGGDLCEAVEACERAWRMNPSDKVTANLRRMIGDVQTGKRVRPTRLS